ncbi:hypothetical protein J1N35_011729 [Gossypium stocksii]|uniref:Reverse transcriptase domain-containing protein n=1 Tax=Gossypium stocksii TaxID=47602 RepID=A0A9D3W301_9ROSI|nr:hypothetical protein J1N35_011729 [Gossypium stocksii]
MRIQWRGEKARWQVGGSVRQIDRSGAVQIWKEIIRVGTKGGLSLGWKGNFLIQLKSFSSYHIDIEVHNEDCDVVWHFTGFYGNPEERNRSELWDLLRSSFEDVLRSNWNELFESVLNKLENLGQQLQRWSRSRARDKKENRLKYEERLNYLYNQDLPDEILAEITDIQLGLNLEADQKYLYWEQRACVNWLKNSDRNTSYFHQVAVQHSGSDEHVFGLVEKKISDDMNEILLQQFTEKDITHAVKSMAPLKAPRIDCFLEIFFQRNWHIFGTDIFQYCLAILNGDSDLVSINGVNGEGFSPSRRLRQGDPLSPYLFLICAEGFPTLITEAKQKGLMKGAATRRERFAVNHLFFADDCILFEDASIEGATVVYEVIKEYEEISGQRVNFEKSLIYFGANVNDNTKDSITNILDVRVALNSENAQDLITNGSLWRIGNRSRVNIWNDSWLPGSEENRVSVQQISLNWSTVNQLINEESNTWNRKLILKIVDEEQANRILSILLSESKSEDILSHNYIQPTLEDYKDFYNSFWPIHILAKIKIHLRRLPNNFLPHYNNLVIRSLRVDSFCPLCKKALEDMDHLLWSCEVLQTVWTSLQIRTASSDCSRSCKNLFVNTFCLADDQSKQFIAISIWDLWYRRNKLIHEGIKFSLQDLLGFIRGYFQELKQCQEKLSVLHKPLSKTFWCPPILGVIKINFDASFQSDSRTSTSVVIARDYKGE